MRLGIWRPGGLGDVFLLAPGLRALRRQRPEVWIHVWGCAEAAYLLLYLGLIDSFSDHNKGLRLPQGGIDAFVGYEYDPLALEQVVRAHGVEEVTTLDWIAQPGIHQAFWHYHGLRLALGLRDDLYHEGPFSLDLPARAAQVNSAWEGAVLLHCGGSLQRKRWPMARYLQLAELVERRLGRPVAFLEAPGDDYGSIPYPVLPRPLLDCAWLQRRAGCFVGNDTGLSHLAGMVGAPGLALFGPTQPRCWRPIGDSVRVLAACPEVKKTTLVVYHQHHDCWRDLHAPEVFRAVRGVLDAAGSRAA